MSLVQIFSIIMVIAGALGIYGALQLDIVYNNIVGPAVMPLIYSIALLAVVAVYFAKGRNAPKIEWNMMLKPPKSDAWIFYILNIVMFILLYLLGTIPSILVFSVGTSLCLKRMNLVKTIVFSALWVAALYFIFVVYLGVQFSTGILIK